MTWDTLAGQLMWQSAAHRALEDLWEQKAHCDLAAWRHWAPASSAEALTTGPQTSPQVPEPENRETADFMGCLDDNGV